MEKQKTNDIQEILNYRKALVLAGTSVPDRPIKLSLIRDLHRVLMDSVRGKDKIPGEFRKDPHPLQLAGYLEAWEAYMSFNDFDILAQTAIVHAQFELLHPFRDGNGRVGRLLIPLFLFSKKRLSSPYKTNAFDHGFI